MVREFVDRVFDGSARPLLLHLVEDKGLGARERRALQELVDSCSGGGPMATCRIVECLTTC